MRKNRRRYTRRPKRAMLYKPLSSTTKYFFKRTLTNNVTTSLGQLAGAAAWSLSMVPGVDEFTALFDQYRICCVIVKFISRSNVTGTLESSTNTFVGLPRIHWVIDLDDATVPSYITTLDEYGKRHSYSFSGNGRDLSIKVKPRTLNAIYRSALQTGYRDWETDRKSTRLNSSHSAKSRMPSSA